MAEAFDKMESRNLFVSCQQLLEKIVLNEKLLSKLKLLIIGAKSLGATKEQPDSEWVEALLNQSRKAGVSVWFKDNLSMESRPQEFPEPV